MSATNSRIAYNLPDFPYSPAIAARRHFSALLSSSLFVTTLISSPDSPSSVAETARSSSSPSSDLADPSQENGKFFSTQASPLPSSPSQISPQPSLAPPEDLLSARIEPLVKLAPPHTNSSKRPCPKLQSSKFSSSPVSVLGEPSLALNEGLPEPPIALNTADNIHILRKRRRRSSWRRLKRMGNRLVAPFRSMGLCLTGGRGAMAFLDDLSAEGASPTSSCYSLEDYSCEYIRAVLEKNVLLGYLTMD